MCSEAKLTSAVDHVLKEVKKLSEAMKLSLIILFVSVSNTAYVKDTAESYVLDNIYTLSK